MPSSLRLLALLSLKVMKAVLPSWLRKLKLLKAKQKRLLMKSNRVFRKHIIRLLKVQKNLKTLPLPTLANRLSRDQTSTLRSLVNRLLPFRKSLKNRLLQSETILQTEQELFILNLKLKKKNLSKCLMIRLLPLLPHTKNLKTNLLQMQRLIS